MARDYIELPGYASGKKPSNVAPTPNTFNPKTVRIIGTNNNMGLTRDREIVAAAFRKLGWEVIFADKRAQHAATIVAVNVHLEMIIPRLVDCAQKNIVIPNPEWWNMAWTPMLKRPTTTVWAKTDDAARIFSRNLRAANVEKIGFCSTDRRNLTIQREKAFLHIAGASPNKGTHILLANWRKEWPHLTVVVTREGRYKPQANISIIHRRATEDEIKKLQNRCLFHIYPSRYEGFGHAQWEGLACGALVFVTNSPPFDEFGSTYWLMSAKVGERSLVTKYDVYANSIDAAVAHAQGLSDAELATVQEQSRIAWEQNTGTFQQRLAHAITSLDERKTHEPQTVPIEILTTIEPSVRTGQLSDISPLAYVGRVNCITGQGTAARHQIHVMRKHGARFKIIDAGTCAKPDPKGIDPFIQSARRSDRDSESPRGTIIHLQPNTAESFHHDKSLPRPHILVSVWETTKLPIEWVRQINTYDQVWCATEWQQNVYKNSGVKEHLLRVVPFAVDPSLYVGIDKSNEQNGKTVFGSLFQWSERKDPRGLIGAFLHAFSSGESVELIIKSYEGDNPYTSVESRVDAIIRSYGQEQNSNIKIISSSYDSKSINDFYRSIDFYVSPHRGEGWNFPFSESLLMNRPVIATDFSAPSEYASGLFRGVKYTLEPPHGMAWQPFYRPDQLWAKADVVDLANAMKEAHEGKLKLNYDMACSRFSELTERAGISAALALKEILR